MFTISVSASSANLGCGFDTIGLALSLYLHLDVALDASSVDGACQLSCSGEGSETISLDPAVNLITRTALYVLKCHGIRTLPAARINIRNEIPLGRGLGSSGAAVVAGVVLGNELGNLKLPKSRLLDYCLMIERHPDNVAAALYGGFMGTYLNELSKDDAERSEVPLAEVLPQPAGGVDTGLQPPEPPMNIGHYRSLKWAPEIKCIAVIPDFEVSTGDARAVLPEVFPRKDVIFNLQRLGLLVTALGESPPDSHIIFQAMQDKLHQPYRQSLIPGLSEILQSETPASHPGLLGICLSGAGPTILALATHNFENIAETLVGRFKAEGISCKWSLLSPCLDGATVRHEPADLKSRPHARKRSIHEVDAGANETSSKPLTYAGAGVSIDRGNALVKRLKSLFATTSRPGAEVDIGGFGGFVNLRNAGFKTPPKLCVGIDGIGTKLKIAFATNNHSTVGIDLVAMNVNDIVVQGAEPLCFLDYFACGKLDVDRAASFCEGVAEGCRQAGCAVIGGETAEMPDLFSGDEYDAAGVAIGGIEGEGKVLPDKASMAEGDILIGLRSSGPHSNGYSLIRKVVEKSGLAYVDDAPWSPGTSVGTELLTPTKIYVKSCLAAVRTGHVKGMAHITGGGLTENIPRMLPPHLTAELTVGSWPVPPVFKWLKKAGNIDSQEFVRVWNAGLGMVLVVEAGTEAEVLAVLRQQGELADAVGTLKPREGVGCVLRNMESLDS